MTMQSRPYFLIASAALLVTLVLTPSVAFASSDNTTSQPHGVHQGKIPVCSGLAQVLEPTTGQPILISIEPVSPCPGPAAEIKVLSPVQSTTCGSSELLTLDVTDVDGYNVKDGTTVALSTTLGRVPETVSTRNGIASASFLALSEESGRAEIWLTADAASTRKIIDVSCL